jgi:iron complex transport system ATP-binding protein
MRSGKTIIDVRGMRIERDAVIIRNIDWRVQRGEHWVIVGANGSGKTSLLRAITGYLPPTAGTIEMLGHRWGSYDWRELRKRVGIVSSSINHMMEDGETALRAVASGPRAQIGYWGELAQADRARAIRILARVEASAIRDRPWLYLSQGERQRVLIGRALAASPRILILDEPCAGLDPVAREHFVDFIDRMARRRGSPSIVLVTHHVEEIAPIFTHGMVLKAGAVLAFGQVKDAMNSRVLSEAFGAPVKLERTRGRYRLRVKPARGKII